MLVLHRLVATLIAQPGDGELAFITAALHILSPAGPFLSAPYGESLFSLLNFVGLLFYGQGMENRLNSLSSRFRQRFRQSCYTLAAGFLFGLATTVRSNGLLSGSLFAYDIISELRSLPSSLTDLTKLQRLATTVLAGLLVSVGLVIPQWLAYAEYCLRPTTHVDARPWCGRTLPSIYTWVQEHYWLVTQLRKVMYNATDNYPPGTWASCGIGPFPTYLSSRSRHR